jgi:hypothetical protein
LMLHQRRDRIKKLRPRTKSRRGKSAPRSAKTLAVQSEIVARVAAKGIFH